SFNDRMGTKPYRLDRKTIEWHGSYSTTQSIHGGRAARQYCRRGTRGWLVAGHGGEVPWCARVDIGGTAAPPHDACVVAYRCGTALSVSVERDTRHPGR